MVLRTRVIAPLLRPCPVSLFVTYDGKWIASDVFLCGRTLQEVLGFPAGGFGGEPRGAPRIQTHRLWVLEVFSPYWVYVREVLRSYPLVFLGRLSPSLALSAHAPISSCNSVESLTGVAADGVERPSGSTALSVLDDVLMDSVAISLLLFRDSSFVSCLDPESSWTCPSHSEFLSMNLRAR